MNNDFFLSSYWRKNQDQPPESAEDWYLINNDTQVYNAEVYHTFEQVIQSISEEYECVDCNPVDDGWHWHKITRYDLSSEAN